MRLVSPSVAYGNISELTLRFSSALDNAQSCAGGGWSRSRLTSANEPAERQRSTLGRALSLPAALSRTRGGAVPEAGSAAARTVGAELATVIVTVPEPLAPCGSVAVTRAV